MTTGRIFRLAVRPETTVFEAPARAQARGLAGLRTHSGCFDGFFGGIAARRPFCPLPRESTGAAIWTNRYVAWRAAYRNQGDNAIGSGHTRIQ